MLQRNIKITFRLNEEEHQSLANQIKKTGLSQEAFIRTLIRGYEPRELPPLDYHVMIKELHAIGSNLNQIAVRANATGHIDKDAFQSEINWLRRAVLDIQEAVTVPKRKVREGGE
jgi:alcohol dehydrogenase YqhD (iron-dependent ADH family)